MPKPKKTVRTDSSATNKPKKKSKRTRPAKGRTILIPARFQGEEPRLLFHEPPRRDVESAVDPDDEASKHKYPPPSKDKVFRRMWMLFINNVIDRDNFHLGHLETLRILCDLYVEYESLVEFIRKNGRSYCSTGRNGEQWKFYPEVLHLPRVQASIREYCKLMDVVLKKDHGSESGGEEDEWK